MASPNGTEDFVEGWSLAQTLGEGAYGEVKLIINRETGQGIAMKMIDLLRHPDAVNAVKKEVSIHKLLKHKHIINFYGKRTHRDIEYIFLEYAAGGELFDRIEPDVGMERHRAQRYFNQLLAGVRFLHLRGITHRDLKPENLLLDINENLKISDFGMATLFRRHGVERLLDKRCGTLPYAAPEVLTRPYNGPPADLWSCGIILVAMLAGELPWDKATTDCIRYLKWKSSDQWTTMSAWRKVDTLALSLLRKMLDPNAKTRIVLDKVIEHRWCHMQFESTDYNSDSTSPNKKGQRWNEEQYIPADDAITRMYQSQPAQDSPKVDVIQDIEARHHFCFSQPAMLEDMLLNSQLNPTQGSSQNIFQKLVRRMTRFFVSINFDQTVKRLSNIFNQLAYTWKINDCGMISISTIDQRKLLLVFKANLVEMDGKILLDFRLSKGCGLEFKRRFIIIKNMLEDVVVKGPVTWPIAVATHSMP